VNPKSIISLATVLALLLSLILPPVAHAHLCAGSEAVARTVQHNLAHGHDDDHAHDAGDHHSHGDDHHDHGAGVRDGGHVHAASHLNEMSYCCYDGQAGGRQAVDTAALPSRIALTQVLATLYMVLPPALVPTAMADASSFKIGSSPPFLASITHSTYLRISVLLI